MVPRSSTRVSHRNAGIIDEDIDAAENPMVESIPAPDSPLTPQATAR